MINRRSFIKKSALFSAPMILPFAGCYSSGPVSSGKDAPVVSRTRNEIPNMAFIGIGIQGRGLLNNFLNQDVHVVAVCDVDKVRCADARKRVDDYYSRNPGKGTPGNCRMYRDFREVIARDDIDMVCIATPDHWHSYITIAAIKSGKDVYCEKPLTYNIAEAKAVMKAVADSRGGILQTGAMQRSAFEFRTAAELVRNGCIGKVTHVDCNFGGPSRPHRDYENPNNPAEGLPNPDVDFDMWCGGAPLVKYSDRLAPRGVNNFFPMFWRMDDLFGSGYCGDWGAHHLDIAQWGLGMDDSGPVKVIKSTSEIPSDPILGGRRQEGVQLVFADGAILRHNPFSTWGTVFYGTEGIVAVNRGKFAMWHDKACTPDDTVREAIQKGTFDGARKVAFYTRKEDGGSCEGAATAARREFLKEAKIQLYQTKGGHPADLVKCFKTREKPCSNEIVGGRAAVLCHLCNLSYVRDVSFDWNPEINTFANGTGDAKWLVRPEYRNGWKV
ncbi:MAG: Gfo/Idh/MocA family oxidoreductase [Kiritimatiellae bacterium]|nr:Gfo/Idh/MocA family oxidoreductase [Kiritimatiellia bacterium]